MVSTAFIVCQDIHTVVGIQKEVNGDYYVLDDVIVECGLDVTDLHRQRVFRIYTKRASASLSSRFSPETRLLNTVSTSSHVLICGMRRSRFATQKKRMCDLSRDFEQ